jgi:N-acetylneuraminic acid mutarotase
MMWTLGLQGAPKRVNHAACAVDEIVYSFGGYCTGEEYHYKRPIDVHQLNTNTLQWTLVKYQEDPISDTVPFQRYGHTVVSYNGIIVLWGGRNDEGACNLIYMFDAHSKKWYQPDVHGLKPASRDGHSATIAGNCMYIFGGFEDATERFSQDMHCLNLLTMTWSQVLTQGVIPKWRDFHSASCIGENIYIFGGRSDQEGPFHTRQEEYDNQLVFFNVKTSTWHHSNAVNPPTGRRSHSSFVYENLLYIFGGYNGVTDAHYDDIHRYEPITNTWSKLMVGGSPRPCPRRRQSCVLILDKLFLFGGTSPIEGGPDERTFFGSNQADTKLQDQSDLYILDFQPSLRTLCLLQVNKSNLGTEDNLPHEIRKDLKLMNDKPVQEARISPNTG